jgi:toxin ParE1/3/4
LTKQSLYSFHPEAIEQQTNIWIYTCQHWGEEQADVYIDGLHDKLSIAAQDFTLLRELPNGIHPQVKFFHYERHYVFLKIASSDCSEKIQVLAILHDSMDIPIKLRELLR